ncbi:MAG TPA: hypothetical protein VHN14_28780, partial [Kofleriaceae bacterium]|nr:hypothetical protein [Kofleriaceae bacterium]
EPPTPPGELHGPAPGEPAALHADHSFGYRLLLNTNLEQVSDWLTKIIVGVGLVELRNLPHDLAMCAAYVAHGLGTTDTSAAMAIILYFPVCGFLGAYIAMRLYLTQAFAEADQRSQLTIQQEQFRDRFKQAKEPVLIHMHLAVPPPSMQEIHAASNMREFVATLSPALVRAQVLNLSSEYESVRASMARSLERTAKMQMVVNKMKLLGLSIERLMPELLASESPGHRLLAIASLQIAPRAEHIPWLGRRFEGESRFVMYQAAIALLAAVRKQVPDQRAALVAALEIAQKRPGSSPDPDTDSVLAAARTELEKPPS